MNHASLSRRPTPRAPADPAAAAFAQAVLAGLAARPRVVPARFLYDAAGSDLFEAITRLPEYYPTRTETAVLTNCCAHIGAAVGAGRAVVEFGSGSSAKTPLLLAAVAPRAYVPIDICADSLNHAAQTLAASHPGLAVLPIAADFTHRIDLPATVRSGPMLGFFPGSTIGNFTHAAAIDLLRSFRATLGDDAWLVIGMDTRKDPARLLAAYDDAAGVTARFNLNLLHRINRELDANLDTAAFAHEARWNDALGRIEMHLRARRDVAFRVLGRPFEMAAGDTIHTENSSKFTAEEARLIAHASGWTPARLWTDDQALFGVHLWHAAPNRIEP